MFEEYEEVCDVDSVMAMLNIGRNTCYNLLISGEIKALRFGRKWRIPRMSVERYIIEKCFKVR